MSNAEPTGFDPFPVLRTSRLLLRDLRPEDAAPIFAMRSDPRNTLFIRRPLQQEITEAENLVAAVRKLYEDRTALAWAAILRDGNSIIGTCGLRNIDHVHRRAEIGGELLPQYWGKGIAPEAVYAILDHAFGPMNLHSVEARVLPGNRSAIALIESMGFQQEALFRDYFFYEDRFHDLAVYSLLAKNRAPKIS